MTTRDLSNLGSRSHCEFPEFRRLVADKLADPELHMPFEEGRHIYNTVTKNVLDKFKTDFSLDSDKTGLTVGAGTDIDWGTHTDTGDWGEVVVYDGTMSFTNETLASCWSGIISRVTYLVNEKIEAVRDEGEFLKVRFFFDCVRDCQCQLIPWLEYCHHRQLCDI